MNVYLFKVRYYDTVDDVEGKAFSIIRASHMQKQ